MMKKILLSLSIMSLIAFSAIAQSLPWSFAAVGDTRNTVSSPAINETVVSEIASQLVSQHVDFVVVPGDLVYAGSLQNFQRWKQLMSPVYNANIKVYPVLGNHDANAITEYLQVFGADVPNNGPSGEVGRTYAFEHNNALIVGLDNYASLNRVNQPWLNSVFQANTQPHVFTFAHVPAFKANHTDCMDDYPVNRDAFWNSLTAANSKVYFCGHDHFYDRALISGNVSQLIVGTGGAPFYPAYNYDGDNTTWTVSNQYHANQYGYSIITVQDYNVTIDFYERVGNNTYSLTDSFSYTIGIVPPPVLVPPSNLKVSATSQKKAVLLTWSADNSVKYDVYVSKSIPGQWVVEKLNLITTQYRDIKLTSGTPYYYFIRAVNDDGYLDSDIVSAIPK